MNGVTMDSSLGSPDHAVDGVGVGSGAGARSGSAAASFHSGIAVSAGKGK
jgi:hypothetical protein